MRLWLDCEVPGLSDVPGGPSAPSPTVTAAADEAVAGMYGDPGPLPCPFCGGEPVLMLYPKSGKFGVQCEACKAIVRGATEDEALDKWERRQS